MFRYKRAVRADYKRQGYIYFISQNYSNLREDQRQVIRELCRACGGDNHQALFEFMTTDQSATAICLKHYIGSKTTLYRAARRYYELFPKIL